ncbi:hypothetical protein HDU96_004288 [Phlyctochytrium bullatum]|nr:hypothetical protein HDU96_004288 [Phlyctochytrium bullatum]
MSKRAASGRAAFDDDLEDEDRKHVDEEILEFEDRSAVSAKGSSIQGPLVIPVLTKKRKKEAPPSAKKDEFHFVEAKPVEQKTVTKYGLQIVKKETEAPNTAEDDEITTFAEERLRQLKDGPSDPVERYQEDLKTKADEATLDDYERIPIDQFGAAILRGMGWEDGKIVGKSQSGILKPVFMKPRPHLLGLGAERATEAPPSHAKSKHDTSIKRSDVSSPKRIVKGCKVIIKKRNDHYKKTGIVQNVREARSDGIPITVELPSGEVECLPPSIF